MSLSIFPESLEGVLYISCMADDTDDQMSILESALIAKDKKEGRHVEKIELTELPTKRSSKREKTTLSERLQNIKKIVVVSHHSFYDLLTGTPKNLDNRRIGGINIKTVVHSIVTFILTNPIAEVVFYNCELGLAEPLPNHPSIPLSPLLAAEVANPITTTEIPSIANPWILDTEIADSSAASDFPEQSEEPSVWDCHFGQEHSECIESLLSAPQMSIHVSTLAYITNEIFKALSQLEKTKEPRQFPPREIVIKGLNGIGFIDKIDGKLWSFHSRHYNSLPIGPKATAHKEEEFKRNYVAFRKEPHVIAYHINSKRRQKVSKRLYPPLDINELS